MLNVIVFLLTSITQPINYFIGLAVFKYKAHRTEYDHKSKWILILLQVQSGFIPDTVAQFCLHFPSMIYEPKY